MKRYVKNNLEKVLLWVIIDVLTKHFGEEKLSDHKTLSKTEKDMLLLKEIDIQYNIKNGGYLIDQLIK